jgi:hypothetical protein
MVAGQPWTRPVEDLDGAGHGADGANEANEENNG